MFEALYLSSVVCLTDALYHEARGEYATYGIDAYESVTNTIINRHIDRGISVCAVVYEPYQFSFLEFNKATGEVSPPAVKDYQLYAETKAYAASILLPIAIRGRLYEKRAWVQPNSQHFEDQTCLPDHYLNEPLTKKHRRDGRLPTWARVYQRLGSVGQHTFYASDCTK